MSEITFPTHFNKVTDTKRVYYKKDKVRASLKVAKNKISRPYDGEKIEITKGEYGEIEKLFNEINRKVDLDNFTYSIDPITKHLSIWMHYWEDITFESPQIPRENPVISIALSHRKTSFPTTLSISLLEPK